MQLFWTGNYSRNITFWRYNNNYMIVVFLNFEISYRAANRRYNIDNVWFNNHFILF